MSEHNTEERFFVMKKILVVLTGGTIGSQVEGESVRVTDSSPMRLMELYEKSYGQVERGMKEEFEVIQPMSILSENMGLKSWTHLCRIMWEIPYENYAGVIVTHGSDTLSYTSALLGLLLCHVEVPVVLTASNYPLGEKGSNGLKNFRSAVELIHTGLLKGVFTVYQNGKGENNVYLATRLTEADGYLDQFGGFGGVPFGRMCRGEFQYDPAAVNPTVSQVREKRARIADHSPSFEKSIVFLKPYPGFDYESVDLSRKPAAVLQDLYHSSTACVEGESSSILWLLEKCKKADIPVYTASVKDASGRNYETARRVLERGAIPMENISPEAAYSKLLLLYNLYGNRAGERMSETYYFEHLPKSVNIL